MMDNFTAEERAVMPTPKYFYEVEFNKPGGLVMPLIVEYKYIYYIDCGHSKMKGIS